VQPIQRSAYPDPLSSPATNSAALIDEQARTTHLPAAQEAGDSAAPGAADASGPVTLIWVEGAAAQPSPGFGAARSIIVAAHRRGETCADRSFIICFPVEAWISIPQLPTVLRLLKGLGWSLLTRRRTGTAVRSARAAVLANTARPGPEQRLWLSEPRSAVRPRAPRDGRAAVAPYRTPQKPAVLQDRSLELRRRTTAMVIEGGASVIAGE